MPMSLTQAGDGGRNELGPYQLAINRLLTQHILAIYCLFCRDQIYRVRFAVDQPDCYLSSFAFSSLRRLVFS